MMSLPLSCQNEGRKEAGRGKPLPPLVSAPESALGSHSCVALSSAQVNSRLHHSHPPLAHKNVHRFRVDFYLTQRAVRQFRLIRRVDQALVICYR